MDKTCFVISPIGDPESETRKRSDKVLKYVIAPAVEQCGYKSLRADQISEPGMITSQVIQHIVDDPLVVADLTDRNPNVFYELAVRHMLRKPLVQIIKKGEALPFDVAGSRTVHIDHRDLDSVEEAKSEIIAQVKSLENDPSRLETPISVSLDLQTLRQSDNPEQRSLADVLSALSDLRSSLNAVEKRMEDPENLFPPPYFRHLMRRYGRDSEIDPRILHELEIIIDRLQISDVEGNDKQSELVDRLRHLQVMLHHPPRGLFKE